MSKSKKIQVHIRVKDLVDRLYQLLELKKNGAEVGSLIMATEDMLEDYAESVADKDKYQIVFLEEE